MLGRSLPRDGTHHADRRRMDGAVTALARLNSADTCASWLEQTGTCRAITERVAGAAKDLRTPPGLAPNRRTLIAPCEDSPVACIVTPTEQGAADFAGVGAIFEY